MARPKRPLTVNLLPIQVTEANHPCPWIRATELLMRLLEHSNECQHDIDHDDQSKNTNPVNDFIFAGERELSCR